MVQYSAYLTRYLYPNYSIRDVRIPIDMSIYSFTPCGKFLICFSLNSVLVYIFNNQAGISLDQDCFKSYFTLKAQVLFTLPSNEELSNDFCVATVDNKYIIVVTYSECLPFHTRKSVNTLESISVEKHYTFHTISLITGKIIDRCKFKNDYIEIEHHKGVGLVQNVFTVLSLLHQTIYIIQINSGGELHELQSIGWNIFSDDPLLQDLYPDMQPSLDNNKTLSTLHQAVLSFLYKQAESNSTKLLHFYQEFEFKSKLKIVRIQLMKSIKMLIKMVPENDIHNPMSSAFPYKLFVILDILSSKVIDVFDNLSKRLHLIAHEIVPSHLLHQLPLESSSRFTLISAYSSDLASRLDFILPLPLQRQIDSPYFDSFLYRFNKKYISVLDRSTCQCTKKITFVERGKTDKLKFTIDPNGNRQHPLDTLPCFTSVIAHPTLPYIITIQMSQLLGTVVNFHLCCI